MPKNIMKKLRRIVLNNVYNLQDLGGYATIDSKVTRWHVLYRSDNLCLLDINDWTYLYTNGIRTVVDLRTKTEVTENQNRVEDYVENGTA